MTNNEPALADDIAREAKGCLLVLLGVAVFAVVAWLLFSDRWSVENPRTELRRALGLVGLMAATTGALGWVAARRLHREGRVLGWMAFAAAALLTLAAWSGYFGEASSWDKLW